MVRGDELLLVEPSMAECRKNPMNVHPPVSILMATNKADRYFEEALASCLVQTFVDFELVIIANGCSDSDFIRLKELCRDERIALYRTRVRYLSFSLDLGVHLCRADLIARMDADDLAYPHRIATQVAYMNANGDISICGSFCDLIDNDGKSIGRWTYPVKHNEIRRALAWGNPLCHPTVIFRKHVVEDVGGYLGYIRSEDYYLWAQLCSTTSVRFANIPEALVGYRADSDSHPRMTVRRATKAGVAASQMYLFLNGNGVRWLFGFFFNATKVVVLILAGILGDKKRHAAR